MKSQKNVPSDFWLKLEVLVFALFFQVDLAFSSISEFSAGFQILIIAGYIKQILDN